MRCGIVRAALALAWWIGATASAEMPFERTEQREPCGAFEERRQPWFGDLHVHTAFSQDAASQDTRTTPRDAYAFARGEPLGIQPFDDAGQAGRRVRLERPLDFAAVTDHAEQLGEVHTCTTPALPGYDSLVCRLFRSWPRLAFFWMNSVATGSETRHDFCGPDGVFCLRAAHTVWKEIQAAAEGAYDRTSACRFTTFVGYEWTGSAGLGRNLHRNVIFRNDRVPPLPASVFEARTPAALWEKLRADCIEGRHGCDALAIPHNSNLSAGMMWTSAAEVGAPIDAAEAAVRSHYEPLVEMMQHKGDSECVPGSADELCDFEQLPYDNFGSKFAPWAVDVVRPTPRSTVRWAFGEGLRLERELGTNPFRMGVIASTDTHLGTPGLVQEWAHPGHGGAGAEVGTLAGLTDDLELNPGGLAVLWAEENSRDALYAAMRRREAYGTSGTRPVVRFFGGYDLPADLCERDDAVARAYAGGVPMGGELVAEADRPPRFFALARMDPGTATHPGTPLERIQIVKGWLEDGEVRERVIDVAGGDAGASVDTATCETHGPGAARLCSVFEDADHDPASPAYYYARVVENPTCRWSQWICVANGVDCGAPDAVPESLAGCCAPEHRPVIRERAWTSPIWIGPDAAR